MISLVLGGARSGKSRLAQQRVEQSNKQWFYLATATAGDGEMQERIKRHQSERGAHWRLIEEPLNLAKHLLKASDQDIILVDCLTLWLSNWLCRDEEQGWQQARQALLDTLQNCAAEVVLVSNEVGQGVVPMGELSRRFVDEAGWLHQDIAAIADRVDFVTAGIANTLKHTESQQS